jgi:hypothetical protein
MEIFCFKCRKKTASKDATPVVMKNGKHATSAICVECTGKVFKIGKQPAK